MKSRALHMLNYIPRSTISSYLEGSLPTYPKKGSHSAHQGQAMSINDMTTSPAQIPVVPNFHFLWMNQQKLRAGK